MADTVTQKNVYSAIIAQKWRKVNGSIKENRGNHNHASRKAGVISYGA